MIRRRKPAPPVERVAGGYAINLAEPERELLERLDAADVPTALTALWAIERVYLDAWTTAAPGAREHAEYVAHWTTPEFAGYVDGLAAAADALGGRHDDVVLEVLNAEVAFWDMAFDDMAFDDAAVEA